MKMDLLHVKAKGDKEKRIGFLHCRKGVKGFPRRKKPKYKDLLPPTPGKGSLGIFKNSSENDVYLGNNRPF